MVTREFLESQEYARKREAMQVSVNKHNYVPKERSYEVWKKTPEEKLALANMMLAHKNELRKAGLNYKKSINKWAPIHIKVW
jgi:hypothetical protein